MPSQHTAIGASSLEQNQRYDTVVTDEDGTFWLRYGTPCYFDDHDFSDAHSGWVLVRIMRMHVCARVFKEK